MQNIVRINISQLDEFHAKELLSTDPSRALVLLSRKLIKVVHASNWAESVFKYDGERSITSSCTNNEIINFEGITENGCYSTEP